MAAAAGMPWPLALLVVLSSLLAVIYVWRVIEAAYLRAPIESVTGRDGRSVPMLMMVPMWVMVLLNIYFGINAALTTSIADMAASALMRSIL